MHRSHKTGFTVVEVFLVITLLAIVAALMVVPVQRLVEAMHVRPLGEVLLSTVRKAHMEARQRNETVFMSYYGESNVLELSTSDGTFLGQVVLAPQADGDGQEALLEFYRLVPEDPEADANAYEPEEEPVDSIAFHPSGASTPFSVGLLDSKDSVRLVMDPFSSEPVLREDEGGES
ncbi:hypothetical protein PDESU_02824 [Pontiella desulfatans]|uniref:Type II secretion system protein H n=1 Tax=Pontiella desulfatans TaxID=2750659 RepID=A0A6C2U329_PONDE|nr:GspH/FimT family pseudopilin [Pontiella desulfatans]VGO14265.1 hypothetical protein PDESU_02824 [Pontiella desulfatans]